MLNLLPLKKNDFISFLLRGLFWKAERGCTTTSLANTRLLPAPMLSPAVHPGVSLLVNRQSYTAPCPGLTVMIPSLVE